MATLDMIVVGGVIAAIVMVWWRFSRPEAPEAVTPPEIQKGFDVARSVATEENRVTTKIIKNIAELEGAEEKIADHINRNKKGPLG